MTALAKKVFELFGKPELAGNPTRAGDTEKVLPSIYRELIEATPPADALAVFPEWQGLLVKSKVLDMSVWVVRSHVDGIALARETGHPALILDDVLRQKGRTAEEPRTALLPLLIAVEQ